MRGPTVGALVLVCAAGGCQCRPEVPDPTTETDLPETAETSAPPVDTGRTGPCSLSELEPNDQPDDATALPLERRACGAFGAAADLDFWEFELLEDAWLLVRVQASDGSIADPSVLLAPASGDWAAVRADDPDSLDTHLLVPAGLGTYQLTVSEETLGGGDRYAYELLVSVGKAPVDWDLEESEPNDDLAAAEPLTPGERVFGAMAGNGALPDFDWFRVEVPAGKQTVTFDVDAWDEGSTADLALYVYDAALNPLPLGCRDPCPPNDGACVPCALEGGPRAVDLDPVGSYVSEGNETVWVQVLEQSSREGPANWYVLDIGLEGR